MIGRVTSICYHLDGAVFSWGTKDGGQFGMGRSRVMKPLHKKAGTLRGLKVCSVAAGNDCSCTVTAAGEFFTWSEETAGRLGHGGKANQRVQRRVKALRGE